MSFLSLIIKNPFRNKSRAFLAIVGIGIGIATIVALGGITAGLVDSVDDTLSAGGADLSILSKEQDQMGTPYGTKTLDEDWIEKINNTEGVETTEGVYLGMVLVDNNKNSFLIGLSPDATKDMGSVGIKITKGKIFTNTIDNKEVTVGKMFLEDENKSLGDNVNIKGEKYKIVGVFESGDPTIDAGIAMPIKSVQKVVEDKNHVSIIYVYLEKGASVDDVSKRIEDKYGKNLSAISSITDIETMAEALAMINAASMGISLLAVLIGGIGIINTMIMSVYERTREIGVLRAVGWKKRRVLGMIIGESMVLTLSSAIIGSILGVIGVELMIASGILGSIGVFYPVYTINIFVQAFSIAIVVGIIGGIYPAWRASRLPPTEALRYE